MLQAPICAFACFESGKTDPSAIADYSCHEESSDSSPAGESNSHKDCGCSFESQALVSQPSDSNTMTPIEIVVSPAQRSEPTSSGRGQEPRVAQNADLPPPKILLLKSTLII